MLKKKLLLVALGSALLALGSCGTPSNVTSSSALTNADQSSSASANASSPASLKELDQGAFTDCTGLASLSVENGSTAFQSDGAAQPHPRRGRCLRQLREAFHPHLCRHESAMGESRVRFHLAPE